MRPAHTLFAGVAAAPHTLFILEIVTSARGGIGLIFLQSESLTKISCYLTAACFSGICGCLFIKRLV